MNTLFQIAFQWVLTPVAFIMNVVTSKMMDPTDVSRISAITGKIENPSSMGRISVVIGLMVILYWGIKIIRELGKFRGECRDRKTQEIVEQINQEDESK